MRYVRADKVLPPRLLAKVREHCTGMIYVPSDGAFYRQRNAEVVRLHRRGLPTKEIAEKVFLSERRVQQLLRDAERGE